MENTMIRLVRQTLVTSLVLLLNITPSWGQPVCASPGCNPTVSDAHANTAGGTNALMNVLGFFNTAFGSAALQSTSTGGGNTAVGQNALTSNDIGEHNTASGAAALETNLTGSSNTAEGAGALESNTTGSFNTATGSAALITNDTGEKNTAVGAKALNRSTGSRNIAIGFLAGSNLMAGNHNIYVGNPGVSSESQAIRIGTAQVQTFIAGIGATPVSGAIVMVDTGTGQLGIGPPSSARYKQDIETMGHRSAGGSSSGR
jgi:hypothetical protein